jgi:hypothetical protein
MILCLWAGFGCRSKCLLCFVCWLVTPRSKIMNPPRISVTTRRFGLKISGYMHTSKSYKTHIKNWFQTTR